MREKMQQGGGAPRRAFTIDRTQRGDYNLVSHRAVPPYRHGTVMVLYRVGVSLDALITLPSREKSSASYEVRDD